MSEWLCQSCWIHTETFHHFYERVQCVHEQTYSNGWFPVGGSVDDVIKTEPEPEQNASTVLDVDLNSLKFEETSEPSVQTDDGINGSSSLDDCNDNGDVAGSRRSTDDEDYDEEFSSDDEDTNIKRKLLLKTNRSAKSEKEEAQIREIFPMKCNICDDVDVSFKTWLEVRSHYRTVHNTSGYLVCCDRKFSKRYDIMKHVLRHINPKAHQCDQCKRVCSNKYALKSHIAAAHAPRDNRIHKCKLCPSSYVTAGVLREHILNQHSESGEQFPCDKCGKRLDHGFLFSILQCLLLSFNLTFSVISHK